MTEKNKYNVDLSTDQILQLINEGTTEVDFQGTMTLRPRATYSSENDLAQAGHTLCKIGRAMIRDANTTDTPEYWNEWVMTDYEELTLFIDALRTETRSIEEAGKEKPEDHPEHHYYQDHLHRIQVSMEKLKEHREILSDKIDEYEQEQRYY